MKLLINIDLLFEQVRKPLEKFCCYMCRERERSFISNHILLIYDQVECKNSITIKCYLKISPFYSVKNNIRFISILIQSVSFYYTDGLLIISESMS